MAAPGSSKTDPQPDSKNPAERLLGILLVHGIGDQRRGNTLARFGEPLVSFLGRWLEGRGGGAELERVTLDPADEHAPAHASVRLRRPPVPDPPKSTLGLDLSEGYLAQQALARLEAQYGPGWMSALPTLEPAAVEGPAEPAAEAEESPADASGSAGPEAASNAQQAAAPDDEPNADESPEPEPDEAPEPEPPEPEPAPPETVDTQWVLAESTWAEAFERPGFTDVAKWSLLVIPWLFITQFVDQLSHALEEGRLGRAMISFLVLVLTFPLALAIQILVLLLVPMALIPLLRPVVAPIQRWISGVLGDTFVLLTSDFQFQSMASTVRKDLEWLAERCQAVVVVAHSQGAAVAHEAVRQANLARERAEEPSDGAEVELLVTFGSAVSHLKALRRVTRRGRSMLVASSLVTLSTLTLAGIYLWTLLDSESTFLFALLATWSLGILLALVAYLMPFSLRRVNEKGGSEQFELGGATKWQDFWATSDPVPNGPTRFVAVSHEVHNRASFFTDHSHYWSNQEEFCPGVLGYLLERTGGEFAKERPRAGGERKRRIRYRVGARVLALVAAAHAIFPHPLLQPGLEVPEPLRPLVTGSVALGDWIVSLIYDALSLVLTTLNLIEKPLVSDPITVALTTLSWPVACILLALLWFASSAVVLQWWEARSAGGILIGAGSGGSAPRYCWWVVSGVLGLAICWFWGSWINVGGFAPVWKELASRLGVLRLPADSVWYFGAYFVAKGIYDTWKSMREMREKWKDEAKALTIEDLRRQRGYGSTPSPPWQPSKPPGFRKNAAMFLGTLADIVRDTMKWAGKREFHPRWAAWIALVAALAFPALVAFRRAPSEVQGAAIGLVALAFGVRAWVGVRSIGYRALAAAGIVVGVGAMPAIAADAAGLGTPAGAGLLALGVAAALSGVAGAELLRRGWAQVEKA